MKLMALLAALALMSPAVMAQTESESGDSDSGESDTGVGATGMGGETSGATPLGGSLTNMDNEDLIGKSLVTEDGTEIGQVEEVITDAGGNQRLVVSTSGMLDTDARMVTIDASSAQFDTSGENIMVTMSQDEIMELPEYEVDAETEAQ